MAEKRQPSSKKGKPRQQSVFEHFMRVKRSGPTKLGIK